LTKDNNIIRLFRTGEGEYKTIWYYDTNPICDVCKEPILSHEACFIVDWAKKAGRIDNLMHDGCVPKYTKHPLSVAQYRWSVLLTEVIPPKSIPVFIKPPSISPSRGDVTVFDVNKIRSDRTNDNAWRSKSYPSLEGASIGDPLIQDKIREREAEIEADPDTFLSDLLSSSKKTALEFRERKTKALPELDKEDLEE